jgi:FkbM family methyltransferase
LLQEKGLASELEQERMLKRQIIRALDRRGGRGLLAALASWYVRRSQGVDVAVYYDGERWVRTTTGGRFSVDGVSFDYYLNTIADFGSEYDAWLTAAEDFWFHVHRPRRGDVIVDVGAGIGTDTLAFAKAVGSSGRVLAIEAHPETFARLRKNCSVHGFSQVACVHAAVVGAPGTVYIETREEHVSNRIMLGGDATAVPVPGVTLDSLCARLDVDHIDLLKMNIEGAERLAIPGMRAAVGMTRNICIAAHSFRAARGDGEFFDSRPAVVDFLSSAGFRLSTRDGDPRPFVRDHIHGVRAPSPAVCS